MFAGVTEGLVIAGQAGKKIRVYSYLFVCVTEGTLEVATANVGGDDVDTVIYTVPVAAYGGVAFDSPKYGAFETTIAGRGLYIGAPGTVGGHINYDYF